MDCWIFWTRFKLRSEKISKPRWQLQQVMKRIKMTDRVDNETKEARLFLSQSNCKESEGNNTNVAFLRAHMAKMVTRLIIKYYHELEGHQMGLNYTINHVREKYLVVHVRKQVKRAIMRECFARDDFDQSQLTSKWRRYPRLDCSKPPDLSRAVQLTLKDLS